METDAQNPVVQLTILDGFGAFLKARGADAWKIAADEGLTLPMMDAASIGDLVPLGRVAAVFERAAIEINDPCIGLRFAESYPLGATGALGFLISKAPTVRDALDLAPRFVSTVASHVDMNFTQTTDGIGRLEWSFKGHVDAPLTHIIDLLTAAGLMRLAALAAQPVIPIRAELSHRGLPCGDLVQKFFGPNVRFNAARTVLSFDPTTLARRNPSFDRYLFDSMLRAAHAQVIKLVDRQKGIVRRVQDIIETHLGSAKSTLDDTAHILDLPVRSLQWQLEQVGTTFERLLNAARRDRAAHLLSTTDMALTDVAAALGFSQQSSFSRACQNSWFGLGPRAYRKATLDERRAAAERLVETKAARQDQDQDQDQG